MDKRDRLSSYSFKYMGGYPGYPRRGTGYFKLAGSGVEFLFIGLKVAVTEKLWFPFESIVEIRLAREIRDVTKAARMAYGLIGVVLPLRLIAISFVDETGQHAAIFNELATERLIGATNKTYRILSEASMKSRPGQP